MYVIRNYRGKTDVFEVDIRVELPNGELVRKRVRSPVTSRSGTETWAKAKEREILLKGLAPKVPQRAEVPTLAEFWKRFLSDHVVANAHKPSGQESKKEGWRVYLEPALGNVRLDDIDAPKVASVKATILGKGLSKSTVNKHMALLRKMLKVAVEWGVIATMPVKIPKLKTQTPTPRFYEEAELERLIEAARQIDLRIHLLVLLGAEGGLRRGETIALERSHCDMVRGKINVEWSEWEGKRTEVKGIEAGSVPMTTRLQEALKAYRHIMGPRVLYQDDGTPITKRTIRTWMAQAQKAAGLRASGEIHILRHTFCSHLAMRGAPVGTIQKLARHRHLATTIKYMHVAPGETDRAIALLNGRGEIVEKPKKRARNAV